MSRTNPSRLGSRHLAELRRPRSAAAALLVACAAGAGACRPAPEGLMVSIPPPRNWEASLSERRQAREDYLRSSPETPLPPGAVEAFSGLQFWEPDPRFYFAGELNVYRQPKRLAIPTTAGGERPAEAFGWVGFTLDGTAHRLQVYRLLDTGAGPDSFLLPFRDATSGRDSYPAGRYLDLVGQGPYVLDFNTAYNPSCAYGDVERFACPRAPSENTLPVAIEAGERGYLARGEPNQDEPAD